MLDFLQVCPFTGIGFSTMLDFCKCVSIHWVLGYPLQCLTFTSVCILSMVLMCPLLCLTFTSVSFHWVLGCPRRLPLAFVTRQMEPLVERDPIQEHRAPSTGRNRAQMFTGETPDKYPLRKVYSFLQTFAMNSV